MFGVAILQLRNFPVVEWRSSSAAINKCARPVSSIGSAFNLVNGGTSFNR